MIRPLLTALSAAVLTYAIQPAVAQIPDRVEWTISPSGRDGEPGQVQLTIEYRSENGRGRNMWSNTTDLADLAGLSAQQLAGEGPVRFSMVREAGRFDCEGTARQGRGTGDCSFTPDAAFSAALARRGIGTPSRQQSYSLTLARVGAALLDVLDRNGYQRPDIDGLVSAGIHRVDAGYIAAMAAAGYRVGEVGGLVRMRIHRVTPEFVGALAAAGYRPSAEMAVRLRIHGATPDYIRELAAAGGTGFEADDLISLRIHRVTPEFIRELRSLGYDRLTAQQLTSMSIHDVSANFARRMNEEAGRRLSPEELVSRRIRSDRYS
jgi:hypothetical protein